MQTGLGFVTKNSKFASLILKAVSKTFWFITVGLLITLAGLWLFQNYFYSVKETTPITIDAPHIYELESVIVPAASADQVWTKSFKVKYGDSFHKIMSRLNLSVDKIRKLNNEILNVYDLDDFVYGLDYKVNYNHDFTPQSMVFEIDPLHHLQVNFITEHALIIEKETIREDLMIISPIMSSLVNTVTIHGAPEKLADLILSALAWKVDFRNLLKADSLKVIYEALIYDSQVVEIEKVKSIHFKHNERWFYAYGYDIGNGWEYFNESGKNLSHAPLVFDRITSLYAQKRFHPVRRRWKAHYGMDFEAEEGTPVESILDGVITRVRYDRANGNNVKIRHSKTLTTQYLHFSKIAISLAVGDSVKRGDVIGYVGSTGWSSGPHLCLRVWHNGYQKDPLQFDFPRRDDVPEELKEAFQKQVIDYDSLLK